MSSPILTVSRVSKRFDATVALSAVDLSIRAGEVVALMGANGAGKSTLVKILSGVVPPDGGTLTLRGAPYRPVSPRAARQLGVATVHQAIADAVVPTLSIADNLLLDRLCDPASPWRAPLAARRDAAAPLAARVGLDVDLSAPLASLSLAGQQRVTLARALATHPALLILDEPTASLSAPEADRLFALLDTLRAEGVAILLVSHRLGDLRRIADRVAIVRDGRIVADLPAPIDFDAALDTMIGRPLRKDRAHRATEAAPLDACFSMRDFRSTAASTPFDLDVRRGEIVALAGPVGGGKSRVARAIFGADPLDAGEIRVHGATVTIRTPADAVAHGIGYLSEDRKHFGLALGMDVQNNIALSSLRRFARRGGLLDARAMRDTAQAYVRRLAIRTPSVAQPARLLSGGNQQKIVIAKWLLRDCDILFFDEPTRGIDVGAKSEIYALLDALAAAGKAIVMISSELPEVLRMSHRILVMCEGRVTGELSAAEATQENIMQLATRRESSVAR